MRGELQHSALCSFCPLCPLIQRSKEHSPDREEARAFKRGLCEHTSGLIVEVLCQEPRMSAQKTDSSDEIQQRRDELQLVIEERQASTMHDMREMMAELMRNNGPSESSSAEGSAAARASPRGAEPTAVKGNGAEDSAAERGSQEGAEPTAAARQTSAAGAATARGGARGYSLQQEHERRLFVKMPRVVLE